MSIMILNESLVKEKIMSCPYFREGYFGICVAPDAIHVPGIDEMERFCFRSWYGNCPISHSSRTLRTEKNLALIMVPKN